jgi:hypothetical protein
LLSRVIAADCERSLCVPESEIRRTIKPGNQWSIDKRAAWFDRSKAERGTRLQGAPAGWPFPYSYGAAALINAKPFLTSSNQPSPRGIAPVVHAF